MVDTIKQSYNKYPSLPSLSYNCIEYMLYNNELIWRLLYYSDPYAFRLDDTHPNLTLDQKRALIYAGVNDETNYRVFVTLGQSDGWNKETCTLRISPTELNPTNYVYGNVSMGFQVYCHDKIDTLANYQSRLVTVTQQVIEVFNGQEIGGLGRLYFDSHASSSSRMRLAGSIPFRANFTVMCNWMV
jgi:hypothetical protein